MRLSVSDNTITIPPILHRFLIMADYIKFSLATGGRFTITPSLGRFPANIAISDIPLKLDSLGYISLCSM